jgi:hypothetical protein
MNYRFVALVVLISKDARGFPARTHSPPVGETSPWKRRLLITADKRELKIWKSKDKNK